MVIPAERTFQQSPSDEQLVQSAQQGALEAFNLLCERYLPVVYQRVRYLVPEADAEDVTQEVFLAVMRSLSGFRGEARFSTWLRTLTNRQIADYYRRRGPVNHALDSDDYQEERASANGAGQRQQGHLEEKIMLRVALNQLPAKYKEVILLRFAEGKSFQEIAAMQDQSLEATKSLFRRAIAALQKEIRADENDRQA